MRLFINQIFQLSISLFLTEREAFHTKHSNKSSGEKGLGTTASKGVVRVTSATFSEKVLCLKIKTLRLQTICPVGFPESEYYI